MDTNNNYVKEVAPSVVRVPNTENINTPSLTRAGEDTVNTSLTNNTRDAIIPSIAGAREDVVKTVIPNDNTENEVIFGPEPAATPQTNVSPTIADTQTEKDKQDVAEAQAKVKSQLTQNAFDPQLPSAAIQTFTPIEAQEGEELDPATLQVKQQEIIAASNYTAAQAKLASATEARQVELDKFGVATPTTAAAFEAAEAIMAESSAAIKGTVSRLATASTATATQVKAAYQDLDNVDPKTLAESLTHKVPNEATVKGQLDGLLSGLETNEIPVWAQPAVDQANAQLAARGLSQSSVGRNALFNSIIQAAMPIAQADAAAKLSVFQQDISNEQQAILANAQFFQTLTLKNLDNRQQAAVVNATNATNTSIANAQNQTQASLANANAFLQMDMLNTNNAQQSKVIDDQFRQQTMLTNTAAANTARQTNAANQQQADQFNANLATSISTFNATLDSTTKQFNTQLATTTDQFNTSTEVQQGQFNAGQINQAQQFNSAATNAFTQFNAQIGFQRDQFNIQNATAIAQSNVAWRRDLNKVNTAGQNAVNQANAMNQFNLSNQALTFLWQEQRDAAKWANDNTQNEEERKTRMAIAALGNESIADSTQLSNITSLASAAASIFDSWGN